jgi:hypothetical protein
MPAVIDTPAIVEHEEHALYEAHDLHEEQPQARAAHPGFWHTVVQSIRRQRVHTLQRPPSSLHVSLHPFETPVEFWARQYPSLYLQAFAGQ